MYHLPRIVPADVRALLEEHLEDVSLEGVIERLVPVVLRLFNARDVFFVLRRTATDGEFPEIRRFASADAKRSAAAMESLLDKWCGAGFDEKIGRDFETRGSCISYSAFSWPYGSLKCEDSPFSFPRDFTLLLPISSQLSVRRDGDPSMHGYFALFFDGFPQLNDNLVQLITFIPATLSDVFSAYQRTGASDGQPSSQDLSEFAHDMKRTLLFAAEQLHVMRYSEPPPAAEPLERLERSVTHLLRVASDVLLADRAAADNLKISSLPISLNELVQDAVSNFGPRLTRSKTELKLELANDLPLSPIDPAVFPTVIENLLDNALKYSGPSSCIYLRTKKTEANGVRLEIMDNGCGIPEAEWQDIFRKHYRGDHPDGTPGNGLGLFLVRKIVEAHRGRVYPEKAEEMKTCFVVELPTVGGS